MAVNLETHLIATLKILFGSRTDGVPRYFLLDSFPLEDRKRLACVEPEFGVEGQRTVLIGGLAQSHPCNASLPRSLQYVFHQPPANRDVLFSWVNSDGADTGDSSVLPQ